MAHAKRAETPSTKRWLVGGAAALLVLSVGGGQAFGARSHAPRHQALFSARSTTTAVNLQAMPRGTVSLRQNGSRLEATISAFGLTPGSTHGAEITGGEGPIIFSPFTAGPTGQAAATLTSVGRVSTLSRHAVFEIDFSTSPGQPIAQAPVGASRHGRSVQLQAVESGGVGSLAGSAHLNYNASTQTLTVRVDANGFLPDTDHAAHVHSGSCDVQGAVMVMLTDLHAGQNGQIHQTDVVKNLASFSAPPAGWYLNIHEGTSATILNAAGQPTPQFRPLLCANLPAGSSAAATSGGQAPTGTPAGAGAVPSTAMTGGGNPAASAPTTASTGATRPSNMSGGPSSIGGNVSSMGGSPASGNGQNGGSQGGTSPSAGGSPQAPTTATGATPASSGNGASSTSSGSQPNATSAGTHPELSAVLHPTGANMTGENSTVTLRFDGTQICSTLDLPGVQTPVAGEIDRPDGSPLATFGFDALTSPSTFRGCASVDSATVTAISGGAGALQFKVMAPGTPPVALEGTL